MNRSPDRGMTLLEVVLAAAIAGTVMSLVIPLFLSTTQGANVQTGVESADRSTARVLKEFTSSLRSARIVSMAATNEIPSMTYRLPADGAGVDIDGDILWGPLRTLTYESLETIDESDRGIDLNGDGDRGDRFLRCRIRVSLAGEGNRALAGSQFVLNASSLHGDIDGDGIADPPFTTVPGGLRIVLWSLIRADVTGLRRAEVEISMRNPTGN